VRPPGPLPVRRAFLLAGRATRLPGKFGLVVDGEPVIAREQRVLSTLGLRVEVVSVAPLDIPGLPEIRDRFDRGPLGGLATALSTTDEAFFLFGGDMPFLDPEGLRRMRSQFDGRTTVPLDSTGTWQVLHAIYAVVPRSLAERWATEGRGLRDLVAELDRRGQVRFLPPGTIDPRSFTDLDTPEDLARFGASIPARKVTK
jgi:molybdopterin-guanine dinucleotide biosynthesis protein A